MSEFRRAWGAMVVAVALMIPATPAQAQFEVSLRAEVRRLEREVDSLRGHQRETSALIAATPEIPAASLPLEELESVSVGALHVRMNRSELRVEEGATIAWARMTAYYGDVLQTLPIRTVVVQALHPDSSRGRLDGVAELSVPWDLTPSELAEFLVRKLSPISGDVGLRGWYDGYPAPIGTRRLVFGAIYERLMMSTFSPGQACATGTIGACRSALLLLPAPEQWNAAFPTANDRYRAGMLVERGNYGEAVRPLVTRCVEGHDDEGCQLLLATVPADVLPRLEDAGGRRTLLEVALRLGGPGAYGRLLEHPEQPMGERLARAAGVPLDQLLTTWRDEVMTARRTVDPWTAGAAFGGIAWIMVFAFTALWSSRWRAD